MPDPLAAVRRLSHGVGPWDAALAGGLFAVGLADVLTTDEYAGGTARLAVAMGLQTLPLVWHRTRTVLAISLSLLGLGIEVAGQQPYGGVYGLLGLLVLVHATARYTSGTNRWQALLLILAGVVVRTASLSDEGPMGMLGNVLLTVAFCGAAWVAGLVGRRARDRELELVASREAAITAERARISRDLHDVVGHALSGIALTAGAAQRSDRQTDLTEALELIRVLSRDAASDVRRLVGLLREERDGTDTEPQPTLDAVADLVDRARRAGLDVELRTWGTPVAVSNGLQLAAFRVVQEGVTNVARHARGAGAAVDIDWQPGRLYVSVRNEPGGSDAASGNGYGIVGLRERVAMYGGALRAEPTPDGGFVLEAGFPL